MKNIAHLIKATVLSVLVFFSLSFLDVCNQIYPQKKVVDTCRIELGFPFKFYEQFQLRGNEHLNWGSNLGNFFLDSIIIWILVCGIYLLIKKIEHRNRFKKY